MICPNCKNEINAASNFCMYCGAEFTEDRIPFVDIEPDDPTLKQNTIPTADDSQQQSKPAKDKNTLIFQIAISAVVLVLLLGVLITVGAKTNFFGLAGETVTDAEGDKVRSGVGTAEIAVRDADGTVRQIKTDRSLVTPDSILTEYTEVTNKLKTDSPGFTMVRYQNLPTDKQNLGAVAKLVLPIIERYVTSKEAAKPTNYASGNADKLPIANSPYGCLLTDTAKIKTAYCEILKDGSYKLVITLNDEKNPKILSAGAETSDSSISAMFDPYDAAEQITAIAELALSNIDFNYTDCTATIVYDNKSKEVKSLDMTMNIDITANAYITELNARIIDTTSYTNFEY